MWRRPADVYAPAMQLRAACARWSGDSVLSTARRPRPRAVLPTSGGARTHTRAQAVCPAYVQMTDVHQLPPGQRRVTSAPARGPGSALGPSRPLPSPGARPGVPARPAGLRPFPGGPGRGAGAGPRPGRAAGSGALFTGRGRGREFPAPRGHKRRKQRPRSGRPTRGLGGRRKRGPRSADPGIRSGPAAREGRPRPAPAVLRTRFESRPEPASPHV